MKHQRLRIAVIIILIGFVSCGCTRFTNEDVNHVLVNVDKAWKADNERIKREIGTRKFMADYETAFLAASMALKMLGFTIVKSDKRTGVILGKAEAPLPLTQQEWFNTKQVDQAQFKSLAAKLLPGLERHVWLNADNVEIQMALLLEPQEDSVDISVGYTQVDHKNPPKGLYAMKQPPPITAMYGMLKFWTAYEAVLRQLAVKKGRGDMDI